MEHADALREMSVEKYLLGELTGPERESFEEHMFECPMCATDVKSGVLFAEVARQELAAESSQRVFVPEKKQGWFDWLFRPQWMAPALAACMLLIGYQSVVRIPALEQQVAQTESPQILENLSFSAGATRGEDVHHVNAPEHGQFGLSVDLPPQPGYAEYVFSLVSPTGATVWTKTLPVSEARETEHFSVPIAVTQAGKNTFIVQGARDGGHGSTMDELQKHEFVLDVQK